MTERSEIFMPKVVLVVDDETGYRNMLQRVLGQSGYNVLTAASGPEALDIIQKNKVDIVVTDMKMSPMDGLDTLIAIRNIIPGMPVILMTGYAVEERVREALQRKASTCLSKPFNIDELYCAIQSIVG